MGNANFHETHYSETEDYFDGCRYYARFETKPFSKGQVRLAFRGTLYGTGPRDGSACVTKVFQDTKDTRRAKIIGDMKPDMAASIKAHELAMQFNSDCLSTLREKGFNQLKEIKFVIPIIAKIDRFSELPFQSQGSLVVADISIAPTEDIAIEPYISGKYDKFNTNGGAEKPAFELLMAFTHWTWQVTGQDVMVCDLQGVEREDEYVLTDPAIHAKKRSFGPTDFADVGMGLVLSHHTCNAICKELGLINPYGKGGAQQKQSNPWSTTYLYQLSKEQQDRIRQRRGAQKLTTLQE